MPDRFHVQMNRFKFNFTCALGLFIKYVTLQREGRCTMVALYHFVYTMLRISIRTYVIKALRGGEGSKNLKFSVAHSIDGRAIDNAITKINNLNPEKNSWRTGGTNA